MGEGILALQLNPLHPTGLRPLGQNEGLRTNIARFHSGVDRYVKRGWRAVGTKVSLEFLDHRPPKTHFLIEFGPL